MCFVFIWEQTATCATYSINWSVFITEMKSVYSAVRTGSLNRAVCAWALKGKTELTQQHIKYELLWFSILRPCNLGSGKIHLLRNFPQTLTLFHKIWHKFCVLIQTIKNHGRLFWNRTTEKQTRQQRGQVLIPFFILFTSMTHPKLRQRLHAAKFFRSTSRIIAVDERSVYTVHSQWIIQKRWSKFDTQQKDGDHKCILRL